MAEVLVKFSEAIRGSDGQLYSAQMCGDVAKDGLWEGWVEFVDAKGGAIRTGRETEQPNRADLLYWGEGLSAAYLEGALDRAMRLKEPPQPRRTASLASPRFEKPADRQVPSPVSVEPRAALDPFMVYRAGEHILRQQLMALSRDQVRNIALAHRLVAVSPDGVVDKGSQAQIVDQMVSAVRARMRGRQETEARTSQT